MSDKTTTPDTTVKKHYLTDFTWLSRSAIAEKARQPDTKWFKSSVFISLFLYLILNCVYIILNASDTSLSWKQYIFYLLIIVLIVLPVFYLCLRKNRFFLTLSALYIIADIAYGLYTCLDYSTEPIKLVLIKYAIACFFVVPLLNAVRIQNYRIKNHICPQPKISSAILLTFAILAYYIVIYIGISFYFALKTGMLYPFPEKKQEAILVITLTDISHTIGYPKVCRQYGHTMEKYPQEFKNIYASELNRLNNILKENNISSDHLRSRLLEDSALMEDINATISQEMDNLRREMIMNILAEESNLPIDQIAWNDSYYIIIDQTTLCQIIDEKASIILHNKRLENIIKTYMQILEQ